LNVARGTRCTPGTGRGVARKIAVATNNFATRRESGSSQEQNVSGAKFIGRLKTSAPCGEEKEDSWH